MAVALSEVRDAVDARALLDALLSRIELAVCLFDREDRVVFWNDAYLRFFPEEAPIIRPGIPYAETLRRYFETNLSAAELPLLERHVEAGLERHRKQNDPYVYQRQDGRWYEVRFHRFADGGRLKIWSDATAALTAEAARSGIADAVAADIGVAQYDAEGRFILANKAMGGLFPWSIDLYRHGASYGEHLRRYADQILAEGERARIERLAARENPGGEPVREPMIFQRRDGGWLQLEERLIGGNGLMSLWTDVTGRMNAEAQVSRLRERLTDAIDSLADGFALYDSDDRLVICNDQYRELNAVTADLLVPGVRWEDFVREGARRGQYADAAGREEEWVAERKAQRARVGTPFEVPLSDGRWMRVVDWRTREGGTVGIRIDVTARREREAEIARRTAMLDAIGYAASAIVGRIGWQGGIRQLLSKLGEAAEVSRVSIFQVHRNAERELVQSCRFDWAAPGLVTLSDDPRNWNQSLTGDDPVMRRWTEERRGGRPIQVMARDLTGELREEFDRQGSLSFVSVPIFVDEEWWGHIGFDDCRRERVWTSLEIDILTTAGTLIASAIERAQVEERLRLSEERYRRLVDLLPDGVMLHDRRGIRFLNAAGRAILGLSSPEDLNGRSYADFMVDPRDPVNRGAMRRLLESGGDVPVTECRVRTDDGREIFLEAEAVPFSYDRKPTALILFRDITRRIETERELASHRGHLEELVAQRTAALTGAEGRLMAAITTFKGGIALYDSEERLVVANDVIAGFTPSLAGILKPGVGMEEVTRAIAAARGHDEGWIAAELRNLRGPEEFNQERLLPDGRCIAVSVRHPPDGSTLIVATDVTPYRDAAEALRSALRKEKQLGQLQREFISLTSHEFRTPLAIIDMAIQRLMRRKDVLEPDEFDALGGEIRDAVTRMVGHIDSILSTSRLDQGEIEFRPAPCDLRAILTEVVRRHAAFDATHDFSLDLEGLPRTVFADAGLIDHIATNLLSNAVKFSPDGGPIAIRGWAEDGCAVWSVADRGVGIPAEDIPRVVRRFYRARTSIGVAGTGLGLSFVDKLATMHGGEMIIASTEGEGTTVTIRLPVRPAPSGVDGDGV
ncbi:PAS-domain containing protein [Inquilinus sp. CAU 1745]|uniref:PAS-domain containing protein n=1 Tax=Inquilinus sp. CAU 1745 TaxID=3140369 RepID=UPI00325A922E